MLAALQNAPQVVTSVITRIECLRTLTRHESTAAVQRDLVQQARGVFNYSAAAWTRRELDLPVFERAWQRFPVEPVRTLDAIHLATALEFHAALGSLTMLSLDERIRANATALGLEVAP